MDRFGRKWGRRWRRSRLPHAAAGAFNQWLRTVPVSLDFRDLIKKFAIQISIFHPLRRFSIAFCHDTDYNIHEEVIGTASCARTGWWPFGSAQGAPVAGNPAQLRPLVQDIEPAHIFDLTQKESTAHAVRSSCLRSISNTLKRSHTPVRSRKRMSSPSLWSQIPGEQGACPPKPSGPRTLAKAGRYSGSKGQAYAFHFPKSFGMHVYVMTMGGACLPQVGRVMCNEKRPERRRRATLQFSPDRPRSKAPGHQPPVTGRCLDLQRTGPLS